MLGNSSDVKDETIHCSNRPLYSVYHWSHIIIQVLPFSERTIMLSTKETKRSTGSKRHTDYPRENNHPVYDLQQRVWVLLLDMFKSLRGIAKLFPSWTLLQKSHLLTTCYEKVGRSSQVPVDVDFHSL